LKFFLDINLSLHIFWGAISLILFWLTFLLRKQKLLHQRIGQYFYFSLILNLVFSLIVCLILLYNPILKYPASFLSQSRVRTLMLIFLTFMPFITSKLSLNLQQKDNINFKFFDLSFLFFFLLGIILLAIGSIFKLFNIMIITGILSPLIYNTYRNFKTRYQIENGMRSECKKFYHLRFINYAGAALHIATFSGGPAVRYFGLKNSFTGLSFFIPFIISLIIDYLLYQKINIQLKAKILK